MTRPILTVRDLRKSFTLHALDGRSATSLRGVSFTVHTGQHVAVAGSSGAGKSSLLRCLVRNYLPDSGQVILHTESRSIDLTALEDRELARLRGRDIGYVSQFLSASPRTSALGHVMTAARRRGLGPHDARHAAIAALDSLGIDRALRDVDCTLLSGGERQRVNLAAGIVSPPRLLLLDEPVSALDPHNREKALVMIERLAQRGVSVLAVYHDMGIIERVATWVLVLDDGRIVDQGEPASVLAHHHAAFEEVVA